MEEETKVLARNIKMRRMELGKSIQSLAEEACISRQAASRRESEENPAFPYVLTLRQIAKALRTSVGALLSEEAPVL